MEHDLLAYLLHGLDPDEERAVEAHLEADAAARKELRQWRGLLDPLNALPAPEPPDALYMDTLRAVAGHMVQIRGPNFPARDEIAEGGPRWWRRVDVLVAASVILVLGLLAPPLIMYMRHQQAILACKQNLYQIYQAYTQYWDNNGGALPNLSELPEELRVAGMHPVLLREKQCWRDNIELVCPGVGTNHVLLAHNREEVRKLNEAKTDPHWREKLGGQYAYPLGYLQGRDLHGLRRDMGNNIPFLADRPPREGVDADWTKANSPNHGGKGQNVLFLDGRVEWLTTRFINDDDIYLNANGRLAAGIHVKDIVLAPSEARPVAEPVSD